MLCCFERMEVWGAFYFFRYHLFSGFVIFRLQHFLLFFCVLLLLLNYAFSISPQRLSIMRLIFKILAMKDHMWTRLEGQDQDSGLQQFVERYWGVFIDGSGAVLVGNTEAMGELRLPPSGGDAALQHYLNFVQVFNQRKNGTFTWFYQCLFLFECSLTRVFSNSMILDHSRWFI